MGRLIAQPARVAVLMTCHNRRETTRVCLTTLRGQFGIAPEDVFLVDDGSTDGTADAARAALPGITVINGDGSLFWNGGMRLAWNRAKASGRAYDFYLWLNDDVSLEPGALEMLVTDADATVSRGGSVIVAAATTEPGEQKITYSGHVRPDPSRPLRLSLVAPRGEPRPVETFSGNIVLVSADAERILGNLRPDFEHIYGDLDYGFRARAAGIPVVLASRPGGSCEANSVTGSSLDPDLGKLARLRIRWQESKKVHARDWQRFVELHGSGGALRGLAMRAAPYLRIIADRPNRHGSRVLDAD